MNPNPILPAILLWLLIVDLAPAVTRYVDVHNLNPSPPYTEWATAATNIQDAIDVAMEGDQVLVANGVYDRGGRVVENAGGTNRVVVDKPVRVQSVNGPQFTVIRGYQVPDSINGPGAIRCIYLTNGASLSGFTLTNGATRMDGDSPYGQYGGGLWCESTNVLITNCLLTGNSGFLCGGAYQGTLTNCRLVANATDAGGGGAASATLNNCALVGNTGYYGGGAYNCVMNNCTVTGNSAGSNGGAVHSCRLNNCIVYYNRVSGDPNSVNNYASSFSINYSCTTPSADGLGVGNISVEPKLASASHLGASSPCRGAGNADYAVGTDIDGEAWSNPPSMGCDEVQDGSAKGLLAVALTLAPSTVVTNSPATFPAHFSVTFTGLIEGQATASTWDFGDGTVLTNQPYANHSWLLPGEYKVVLRASNDGNPGGVSTEILIHVIERFVYYVAAGNSTPAPPFDSWSKAATTIQDAVDAALPGSLVLVSSGVYRTGGRQVGFASNNRVLVDKPLAIQSVNGPQFTWIEGSFGTRCVSLANGSFLTGFTLTNGNLRFESNGGGVLFAESPTDAVVSNCLITACLGVLGGGGASSRQSVGPPGSDGGTFIDCTFERNQATGISFGFPFPPTFGGAVTGCRLTNCTLTGNSAGGPSTAAGGAAHASILQSCILTSNSVVRGSGGGATASLLVNCLLTKNLSDSSGGAVSLSTLFNCTLTDNTATKEAGGALLSTLDNCIVYRNFASSFLNYSSDSVLNYSCTTPLPASGTANITNDPMFIDVASGNFRLQATSPCINAGNNDYVIIPVDLEGNERIVGRKVDIGAYEWIAVPTHYVSLNSPNPTPPYLSWNTAATNIQDAVDVAGHQHRVLVTNGVYQSGGRVAGLPHFDGSFFGMPTRVVVRESVIVESVNGPEVTTIVGYQVPGQILGVAEGAVRCAFLQNGAMLSGFTLTNGATQRAGTYGAGAGGGVCCVSTAAFVSNCVIVGNASAFRGGGSFRGTLRDCTFRGNITLGDGGGAFAGTLIRCVLTHNQAGELNGAGGGAAGNYTEPSAICTLYNCLFTENRAALGGGAAGEWGGDCLLYNCTLVANQSYEAAVHRCNLQNCIVYYNGFKDHDDDSNFSSSCTTPAPIGNANYETITNAPLFIETNGWANLRLQMNSPCINAGQRYLLLAAYKTDLDGKPRVSGEHVDIGAYEFQGAGLSEFAGWLWQHGLRVDGSANLADTDGDLLDNTQEWIAGTIPTDSLSTLRLLSSKPDVSGVTVTWQSVSNRIYFLERASDLATQPSFSLLASNLVGQPGTTSFSDTNTLHRGPFYYRIGVQR